MIAALAAAVVVGRFIGDDVPGAFGLRLGAATLATSIVWIGVTFATAAEPIERLASFYRKIRPAGPGWGPVAKACGLEPIRGEIGSNLLNTGLGIVFIYGALFTSGAGSSTRRSICGQRRRPASHRARGSRSGSWAGSESW